MVITVEPGCYFNPFLLGPAFDSSSQGPFLNRRRLEGSMVGPAYAVAQPVVLAEQGSSMTLCSKCCIASPDIQVCVSLVNTTWAVEHMHKHHFSAASVLWP